MSNSGVETISDGVKQAVQMTSSSTSSTSDDTHLNNKPDFRELDLGSPVSPLRPAAAAAAASTSSSSSGSLSGCAATTNRKSHSGELTGATPASGPARTRSRPGHSRSNSYGSIGMFSSGGGGGAVNSPPLNVLPTGNICPSGRIQKTGLAARQPARSDVLGSGSVNYGHGSIIRTGSGSNGGGSCGGVGVSGVSLKGNVGRDLTKRGLGNLDPDPEELKRVGNEMYKKGNFLEALSFYDKAIVISPGNAAYRSNRAAALTGLGRVFEAVRECEEAVKLDPSYSRAHHRLGSLLIRLGQVEVAKNHLFYAGQQPNATELQKLKAVERHLIKCADARKIGDWQGALRESETAITAGADHCPQLFTCRAECLLRLQQLDDLDSIMSNVPKHSSFCSQSKFFGMLSEAYLFYVRAQIEMALGRFENAVTCAEKAGKIDTKNDEVMSLVITKPHTHKLIKKPNPSTPVFMMGSEVEKKQQLLPHVFMISFPAQGHINPLLRLGKRIASLGLLVTFTTTEDFGHGIRSSNDAVSDQPVPVGNGFLRFDFIDDEWPQSDPRRQDLDQYLEQLESVCRRRVPEMLTHLAQKGQPVTCFINNPFIPWVSDVAEELGLPSAMLWVQSCACFLSYYYFHHNLVPFPDENAPHIDVQIPTLPLLKWDEIPTFLHPTTPYPFLQRAIIGQYKNLSKPFCILADTFYELEKETFDHTNTLCPIKPVGPLFKDPKADSGTAKVRADPLRADQECIKWLDTKPAGSVVYISFGTVVFLKQEQIDEIAAGIAAAGVPFLWVMKPPHPDSGRVPHTLAQGFLEQAGDNGKVVQFSPQEQVLAHPSLACFMTHCGWNSTMESLTSGVPVIAFPQWGDQVTDAKFLCDVFGTGIQLCRGEHDDRIIPREEVETCLRDATSGPKAAELKKNAAKWKAAAEATVAEGGSSDQNIRAFVDEVRKRSEVVLASASNTCNETSTNEMVQTN